MPVRIVTDSIASLPAEVVAEHDVTVVPNYVRLGTTEYVDGVDITPEEFYRLLKSSPHHPATSQPTPAAFKEVYGRLADGGDAIVSVHQSSQMSGTFDSAQQAAAQLPDLSIQVVDTQVGPITVGLLALAAARAAQAGSDAEAIVQLVNTLARHAYLTLLVPTLEYLRRGGRIGGAQAFLGSLLNVKPVLHIENGHVEPVTRVRSYSKGFLALRDYVRERAPNGLRSLALVHADAEDHRARLERQVVAEFTPSEDLLRDVSICPALATHTGPGTFGLAFVANP